jgi:hypothetical protein
MNKHDDGLRLWNLHVSAKDDVRDHATLVFHQQSTEPTEPRGRGCLKPQTLQVRFHLSHTAETAVALQYPARTRLYTHMVWYILI